MAEAGSIHMQIKQFVELMKSDVPFEEIRKFTGHTLNEKKLSKDYATLFKASSKLPGSAFRKNREAFAEARRKADLKWVMPEIDADSIEAVSDFSEKTDERIKITIDSYQKYFDALLTEENDNEAPLSVEVYSADKKESFAAELLGSAGLAEAQSRYTWASKIPYADQEYLFLVSYLLHVPGSDESDIPVAEGIARGKALAAVLMVTGTFINRKFMDLFKDFF